MKSDSTFNSIFDYSSAFKYHSPAIPKSFNRNQYKSVFSYQSITLPSDNETEDEVQGEDLLSGIVRKTIMLFSYTLAIVGFPLSVLFGLKKVADTERIVVFRLGKLQPLREPGFTFILPWVDLWTRVNLRPQTMDLSKSELLTSDRGIVQVEAKVEYRVCDIINYVMKFREQTQALKEVSLCCLTNVILQKDLEDVDNNRELVCSTLKHELNQATVPYGFEILDVCLTSVKVLKEAEPVDALGTILTALKAATGQTSNPMTTMFPLIQDSTSNDPTPNVETHKSDDNILEILKKVLLAAESKSLTKDISGCFKFDIFGNEKMTAYCCFENGHVSMLESADTSLKNPDISLAMTEDNVRDFLDNKLSPLDAYMEGKVKVSGDWKLLRPLAKVLEGSSP